MVCCPQGEPLGIFYSSTAQQALFKRYPEFLGIDCAQRMTADSYTMMGFDVITNTGEGQRIARCYANSERGDIMQWAVQKLCEMWHRMCPGCPMPIEAYMIDGGNGIATIRISFRELRLARQLGLAAGTTGPNAAGAPSMQARATTAVPPAAIVPSLQVPAVAVMDPAAVSAQAGAAAPVPEGAVVPPVAVLAVPVPPVSSAAAAMSETVGLQQCPVDSRPVLEFRCCWWANRRLLHVAKFITFLYL